MSKNKISVKHHTIPQFYLNSFATRKRNGYWINVYDKNLLKEKPNLVSNIGYIKNFNTIEINGKRTDIFEKMHNEVFEKRFSYEYTKIINKINQYNQRENNCFNCMSMEYYKSDASYCINYEDKIILSYLLAYFIYRGRKLRNVEELFRDKQELIFKDMYRAHGYTNIENIKLLIEKEIGKKESVKENQLISLFKGKALNELAEIIYNHIWVIGYNNTEELLYSSDNGHSLESYSDYNISVGYATYGNIILFPLTPKICVIMCDEKMFSNQIMDLTFMDLNNEQIKCINRSIVFDGIDEIYSKDGNWDTLRNYYKKFKIPKGHKPYGIS